MIFTFSWDGSDKATITGLVNGFTGTEIEIPAKVSFPKTEGANPSTFNVEKIAAGAFKNTGLTRVTFASGSNLLEFLEDAAGGAFENCTSLTTVDFTNATKLTTIPANAFKGTKITALDLSKTKVAAVNNLLGTTADVKNNTLTSVSLPKTVTSIAPNAFQNCNALKDITFAAADNAATIGAGAFAGTIIETLDLEPTKVAIINNLFGTAIAYPVLYDNVGDYNTAKGTTLTAEEFEDLLASEKIKTPADPATAVANTTLKTVKLPNTWTSIVTGAFENCTALATISLKPASGNAADGQTIATRAFNGTAITALDFTGTTVATLPAQLLVDGAAVEYNESLVSVTLTDKFVAPGATLAGSLAACTALTEVKNLEKTGITALGNSEFAGDISLATINTSKIKSFGRYAFSLCASLTSVDLAAATTLDKYAFTATGLTSVNIPTAVTAIPEGCFYSCIDLATVTFADHATFTKIGEYALAYTAIAEITIPACLPNAVDGVEAKAFGGCENLKTFTFNPTADPIDKVIVNDNAFLGCSNVVFVTTEAYMTANPVAPKNATYVQKEAVTMAFTPVEFKKTPGKYYVKWQNDGAKIKIKKTEAKVYDAYVDYDGVESDKTLSMVQFKSHNGYYYIAKGQVALIITDKADLSYEDSEKGDNYHTSWVSFTSKALNDQIMKIAAADIARLDVEEDAYNNGFNYIYGWINSATKGTGWGKVTSGKTLPKGTLYLYANEEDAAAPGLKVVWRDENGNIEDSEVTGIEEIFSTSANENGEIFNLQGVRVNGAAQKGIYIQNGKKFVVK